MKTTGHSAPFIHPIGSLRLAPPEIIQLDNGTLLYLLRRGDAPVVKLEVVIHAGRTREHKPLVAQFTNKLLKEGTDSYTAAQLADILDYYGYSLATPSGVDTLSIELTGLSKYLNDILPVLGEMLASPIFPSDELEASKLRGKQQLRIDLTRAETVGYREFSKDLFGEKHPYGYSRSLEAYDALDTADMKLHYKSHFLSGNIQVFLTGNPDPDALTQINKVLSAAIPVGPSTKLSIPTPETRIGRRDIPMKGQLQKCIHLGRKTFSRHHPDYPACYILNMVLGGYHGSRLSANIREDKGYTYGIYSTQEAMHYDGELYISTEVAHKYVEATRNEIYAEMRNLREELIDQEELIAVRNYLLGGFLTILDGPFPAGDMVRNLYANHLEVDFYHRMIDTTRNIRAETLRDLANIYLNEEEWTETIAG